MQSLRFLFQPWLQLTLPALAGFEPLALVGGNAIGPPGLWGRMVTALDCAAAPGLICVAIIVVISLACWPWTRRSLNARREDEG